MRGMIKAAGLDEDIYLSNVNDGVETQEENPEVSESEVQEAMKPAISQSSGAEQNDPDVHTADQAGSAYSGMFEKVQREMGDWG